MANPSNVTYAVFGADRTANAETIYQYAYGQILRFVDIDLPQSYEVHFARQGASGDAIPQIGGTNGVRIPDSLLTKSGTIMAYIVLHAGESDGATEYVVKIPVEARPKAADTTPTPQDQSVITQAMAVLQEAVEGHEGLVADVASLEEAARDRVASLDTTPLVTGHVVEAADIPEYVSDVSQYSAYGLTDAGWYVFARLYAPTGVTVGSDTTVAGAAGSIVTEGADHVDVAVKFEVAAMSQTVTVAWGNATDTIIFKATDLAVRNLDYRSTFYVYDIGPYAAWSYKLSPDATFNANKKYFTLADGEYTEQTVTAGENVPPVYFELDDGTYTITEDTTFQDGKTYYTPATPGGTDYAEATVTAGDTVPPVYYVHDKVTFQGMTRNVTYRFDEIVDGGIEFVLPEIDSDDHGAWIEVQLRHSIAASATLTPPDNTIKFANAGGSASITAGINVIDLHYTNVAGQKMWTLINVHTNIPA